jgi:DMSO/TMAO reductase YedYZ molybdopterin-dependent catalytic subunit
LHDLYLDRRAFLKVASASAVTAIVGVRPALAAPVIAGKDPRLAVLNDRPINAETPAHLLDDDVTPAELHFVRNNGLPPASVDPDKWTLTVDGESVKAPKTFTLAELKERFKAATYQIVLECGGNGRAEFVPAAKGNQWTTGAVGCARWTGVRLRDVLKAVGVKKDAVYVGYSGADTHLSGDAKKRPISRGIPIQKARKPETLLAWAMNGEDIPLMNGAPLRLVAGGVPASASGKWLTHLHVRDRVHDGAKMGGQSYRVPCKSVRAGQKVLDEDMCIIEAMPVKSLITSIPSGSTITSKLLRIAGHAWAGERKVKAVYVSIDFGATWKKATLEKPKNKLSWQRFGAHIKFPQGGYYEIWARAVDSKGVSQPMVVPGWNPKGYLNNACHRVAIQVNA